MTTSEFHPWELWKPHRFTNGELVRMILTLSPDATVSRKYILEIFGELQARAQLQAESQASRDSGEFHDSELVRFLVAWTQQDDAFHPILAVEDDKIGTLLSLLTKPIDSKTEYRDLVNRISEKHQIRPETWLIIHRVALCRLRQYEVQFGNSHVDSSETGPKEASSWPQRVVAYRPAETEEIHLRHSAPPVSPLESDRGAAPTPATGIPGDSSSPVVDFPKTRPIIDLDNVALVILFSATIWLASLTLSLPSYWTDRLVGALVSIFSIVLWNSFSRYNDQMRTWRNKHAQDSRARSVVQQVSKHTRTEIDTPIIAATPSVTREQKKRSSLDEWRRDYNKYLRSEAWQRVRREVLNRDRHMCHYCQNKASEVHHLRYLKSHSNGDFRRQPRKNLVSVCRSCHMEQHGIKR